MKIEILVTFFIYENSHQAKMLHQFKEESSHHTQLNGFFVNNVILTRYRTRNAIKIMQPIGVRKKETVQQQTKNCKPLEKDFCFYFKG